MSDTTGSSLLTNTFFNRRRALAAFSTVGLGLLSGQVLAAGHARKGGRQVELRTYGTLADLQQDDSLKAGMLAQTLGYYAVGDGGGASYLVGPQPAAGGKEVPAGLALANGLSAGLVNAASVNYRMFGARSDGSYDDGLAMKAAHQYANHYRVPVINPGGEFWLKETNKIPIQTNVAWGHSVFHLDEKFNTKSSNRFEVTSRLPAVAIELDASQKKSFLQQLKPGVQVIPELAPYKNSLVIVADAKDRIGFRSGADYKGQSWAREEIFYVEEHGRILGDIAWVFQDYTSLMAYPADDTYLTIEGGSFRLSGDSPGVNYQGYKKNGFDIRRSRTLIRNQWVGLEAGRQDLALDPRSGFYNFTQVYDVLLENIRLIPYEQDREGKDRDVPAGTYGLGAVRMMNGTFRNVTAEGGPIHWGVFGTNLNKNFRIENCRLNRIDVHFHCWNLYIKDCSIGYRGISVTGGGDLFVENTSCYNRSFINFRRDFGAKWDGNIRLRNCKLLPASAGDCAVLDFNPMDFDYKYPIGFGRSVRVDDFTVDYRAVPEAKGTCWLMNLPDFSLMKHGQRLFFPRQVSFRNVQVQGRQQGLRLMEIPDPHTLDLGLAGSYDGVELQVNARLDFDNVQLEVLDGPQASGKSLSHFVLAGNKGKKGGDALALYPEIRFNGCKNLVADLGGQVAQVLFEHCSVSGLVASRQGQMPGSLSFFNCVFQPLVHRAAPPFYALSSELGTSFINCTLHGPKVAGQRRPELAGQYAIFQVNKSLRFNHLNTRLGKDVLAYYQQKGLKLTPAFLAMLRSHSEDGLG
ncbi:MAG: hypothetical protein ACO1O1_12155 [Adhaeribacter sp.]